METEGCSYVFSEVVLVSLGAFRHVFEGGAAFSNKGSL